MPDNTQEVTIDEAENADGDVIGVITIGHRKVRYYIDGKCIKDTPVTDVLGEVKKALVKALEGFP